MPPPRIIETNSAVADLHDQRRGLYPRPLLWFGFAVRLRAGARLPVLLKERQDAVGCIVLKDYLALRRHRLQAFEDRIATITHQLGLIPLRGGGHGHPTQ